jgi:hypothetical protein
MLNLWKKATTEDSFKPEEKVRILLTEYITVRSEAIARTGHGFQIGGFVIAALSFVEAQAVNWNWKTVVILICIAIFGISGLFMVIRDLLMHLCVSGILSPEPVKSFYPGRRIGSLGFLARSGRHIQT